MSCFTSKSNNQLISTISEMKQYREASSRAKGYHLLSNRRTNCYNRQFFKETQRNLYKWLLLHWRKDLFRLPSINRSRSFYVRSSTFNCSLFLLLYLFRNIKEWVKTAKTDLPADIESCCMNNVTFRELKIQLGKRYAYLHQGDCEHEITFISLRFTLLLSLYNHLTSSFIDYTVLLIVSLFQSTRFV